MRSNKSLTFVFMIGLVFSSNVSALGLTTRPQNRKTDLNVLLITIDTLRADRIGLYNPGHRLTPSIDRFAADGIVFTRAFSHTSTTLPSHANILLGTTPSYHGVHDNANFIVREDLLTLAELLKSCGYSTAAFLGGFPLDARFGLGQGFDVYDDHFRQGDPGIEQGRERRAQAVLDSALSWLKGQKSPWFLWIHCFDPHDPYTPPEPYRSQYAKNPYDGEVAYTDSVMGALFRYLGETGLLSSTFIVFTGDHGESLGEHGEKTHGYLAYNSTIWIPLILRLPGGEHHVVEQNVSHIDIFPTVCDVLGIKTPPFLQGTSLLPLLKGAGLEEKPIFFESLSPYYNMGWAPITGFIFKNEKFIDSPIPELYDLSKDFDERRNLAEGRNLNDFRDELGRILRRQSSEESSKAGQKMDRETQQKLMSLGYLASRQGGKKAAFNADNDVKVLLPLHNKCMEALDLFRAGKEREGAEALKEIITAGKPVSTAYVNLAAVYKRQGRWPDAISVLKMGLANLPDVYDLFAQYITCLYEAGRFDEALQAFETMGYPQAQSDPVIWNYVGLSYWKKGDATKARQSYEKSIAIDKKFAVPYNSLGSLLTFQFKSTNDPASYRKAIEYYEQAIALDPSYGEAFHGLGVAHFQAKNYEKAIVCLKKALDLEPDLDEALYFLGVAYLMRGENVPAYQCFMKYKSSPSYGLLNNTEKARLDSYIAKCKKD